MIDLDELERLDREATPGPWGLWEGHLYIFAGPAEENDPGNLKGTRVTICDATFPRREGEYRMATERGHAVGTPESDFALIVAARNALPDLIAELRALRARVAELERDARLGARVRKAVKRAHAHFGVTHDRIIAGAVINHLAEEGGKR